MVDINSIQVPALSGTVGAPNSVRLKKKLAALAVPEIVKAFQNDPRTQVAQNALADGGSSAPVAGGSYAWGDGIARALSGAVGGLAMKKVQGEFGQDQDQYMSDQKILAAQAAARMPQNPAAAANPTAVAAPQVAPGAPSGLAAQAASLFAPQAGAGGPPSTSPAPIAPASSYAPREAAGGAMPPFRSALAATSGAGQRSPALKTGSGGYQSYKSAAYDDLESTLEQKYGLPSGLMRGIRTLGERSNANQISSANAKTVYQVIPSTRNALVSQHGIDPYASPQAAAEGAAILLSDSLKRNNGDVSQAVAEYHGGTDRSRWGKKTQAYTRRVVSGLGGTAKPQAGQQAPTGPNGEIVPLPDVPALPDRPNAPEAEGANRSQVLSSAIDMMNTGNPYMSARAQELYANGLADQDTLTEKATARRQNVKDTTYQSDLSDYNGGQAAARDNAYASRRDAQNHNWGVADREDTQSFSANEAEKQRAASAKENALQRGAAAAEAEKQRAFQERITNTEIAGRQDLAREQAKARRSQFFSTQAGVKFSGDIQKEIGNNSQTVANLKAFRDKLQNTKTGGALLNTIPGFATFGNTDLQVLNGISNDIAKNSSIALEGSLSDGDRKFIQDIGPGIGKTVQANKETIDRLIGIYERASDYAEYRMAAQADGDPSGFVHQWRAYINTPEAAKGVKYPDWVASLPTYGADGKRTR